MFGWWFQHIVNILFIFNHRTWIFFQGVAQPPAADPEKPPQVPVLAVFASQWLLDLRAPGLKGFWSMRLRRFFYLNPQTPSVNHHHFRCFNDFQCKIPAFLDIFGLYPPLSDPCGDARCPHFSCDPAIQESVESRSMCGASWTAFQRSRNAGAGKGLLLGIHGIFWWFC